MPDRPNIVLLMTDEQRADTIAAGGHSHMITPNLDRLVHEGCLFENAFSPNPICIPARHNLITGQTAAVHGFYKNDHAALDPCIPTLPRMLADGGYDTRAIGKMHFSPPRRHCGFDRMELMEELPGFREEDDYLVYLREQGYGNVTNVHGIRNALYLLPQRSLVPEAHHGSRWVADRAVEYIDANAGERPFFLWASWIAPHPPFNVPDEFADLYRDRELPEPIAAGDGLPGRHENFDAANIASDREAETLRRIREVYFSAVTHVDACVGDILDALDRNGLAENTLVLFTSDHGEMLGDHRRFLKAVPYDQAARVPMIARWPGRIDAGSRRSEFADLNDILPTFLDAAGIEYPDANALPGEPLFTGSGPGSAKDRTVQYIESGRDERRWISLRTTGHAYTYFFDTGAQMLFDLEADPTEQHNLLAVESTAGADTTASETETTRLHLRAKLAELEARWGQPGAVRDGELAVFPVPAEDAPPYATGGPVQHNRQFHRFPDALPTTERAKMTPLVQEYLQATAKEPLTTLGAIDLSPLEERGVEGIERLRQQG